MAFCSTLVLGGARSGKSVFAENLVLASDKPKIYIATGQAFDDEMKERIDEHKVRRGDEWRTIEAPLDVCQVLENDCAGAAVLFDCVTLWISNLMADERDVVQEVERLCTLLGDLNCDLTIVSNEVGLGIVPENALARKFRDEAGRANQMIAAACDRVVFMVAGLPLHMKGQ